MDDETMIRTIRSQALARLAELSAEPKPSYRIDGQSVTWESYQAQLRRTIDWCDAKLAEAEPFEFHTQART